MADPQLEKFLKAAATKRAAAQAPAAVKPVVAPVAVQPSAPVKVAKAAEERNAPSAEPVTPSAEDVKKAEKMRADLLEELPLEDFYSEAARFPLASTAVRAYERKSKIPKERFTSLAGVQGIDIEDMAKRAREGVPFAEYRRTRDGVIGFKPATERMTELDRVANDYQTAERGEAPQRTIGVQTARETTTAIPGFGEGYEIGYTGADEVIETTKPGEHQYSIAAQFIDSFEKANPNVVHLTDMYGQNLGAGNTQKWIEKYVKTQARNRNLTAASPDADEQMGKLRRDAVYYILAKKTVGQWTPGVFVKDVQLTDAERALPLGAAEGFGAGLRDVFAAMSPNVEIVGFNNKGQAVVRQESPAGTALRLLDVLGVSPVGKIKGVPVVIPGQAAISGLITRDEDEGYLQSALRGVQTGASFLDVTLDATKNQSTPVRAAAGLASLVPLVLYPDVTGAAADTYKAAKAYRQVLQDRKIAKAAAPLLDDLVKALKDGDYDKAYKIETALRAHPELSKGNYGIMQAQIRMDAQMAEKLQAMNPELAILNPTLGDDLITVGVNQSPELAEAIYGDAVVGYPYLHFSRKAKELAAKSEKEGIGPTLEAYVNAGNFGRHFERIQNAKIAFLQAAPKNAAEAIDKAISGLATNLRAKSQDVLRLGGAPAADAPKFERLAKLLEDNKAAIIADPKAAFGKDGVLRQAMKADPIVGADDASEFRKAFYPQSAKLSGRIEALKTVDFNTLYQNDLKVFDRAREAVEANIKSRMMAAELLKRELGAASKINVVPTEILDDLMEPGTERLSAFATAKFISTMQKLPKAADRKAWLAAFQTMDAMLRGAAELRGVPVDTYWRAIDIRVVDGKPVFVKGEEIVSATKPAEAIKGFADVADVQAAVGRLRAALAGTDPSYRLKALTRADGSQAGGEVAVGDVVVRAIRNPQPGSPYRVEVFVGGQQKAAFTRAGKLEDAIDEGIDEAQNAMTGRVAAGEPAMREVVIAAPPKTAAQQAAAVNPTVAAEEAKAVDATAAAPPAPALHPKTETVVGGLDPALKADPEVVSRVLAAVDKLKAGSKLPPPPKGANKVLMGAVREELLKSGDLVKLEDGSVVKAGTRPEDVKAAPAAAPEAAPTPAPTPVAPPVPAPVAATIQEAVPTVDVKYLLQGYATARLPDGRVAVGRPVAGRLVDPYVYPEGMTAADLYAAFLRDKQAVGFVPDLSKKPIDLTGATPGGGLNLDELERIFQAQKSAAPAPAPVRAAEAVAEPKYTVTIRHTEEGGGSGGVGGAYTEAAAAEAVRKMKAQFPRAEISVSVAERGAEAEAVAKRLTDQAGVKTEPVAEAVAEPVIQRAAPPVEAPPVAAARQLEEGAKLEQEARRRLAIAADESDEAFDAALAEVDTVVERNRALEKVVFATTPDAEATVIRRGAEAGGFQRMAEEAVEAPTPAPAAPVSPLHVEGADPRRAAIVVRSGDPRAAGGASTFASEAEAAKFVRETLAEQPGLKVEVAAIRNAELNAAEVDAAVARIQGELPKAEAPTPAPVFERAVEAELPVARKAKGFNDKNGLNAGRYEVEIGGQTRRFFRDTKEGPLGAVWMEDVPGSANMPFTFLGNTKDDAIKALQRKYVAEAAPVARAAEEAAAVPEVVKAEEVAAPTQPSGITPAAEVPIVREEIVQPPVAPPAKAEPTVDELQATVDRLAPLVDAPIKRTNVSKTGFTVEIDGKQIRVEQRGDNWVNAATGLKLGETASDAVAKLRIDLIQKPYTAAQDALKRLGEAQAQAATLSSLDDALDSVKKIRTSKDATKFFDTVDLLPLDEAERLNVLVKFEDKLKDLEAKAKTTVAADKFDDLATAVNEKVQKLRPAAAEAPSAAAAAQDALTAQQRHAQAVSRMRTLTHRAEVMAPNGIDYVLYGALENERFVPVAYVSAREAATPSAARAALYDQLTVSDVTFAAARREAEALLEGQTPVTRAFPANKYANDADLEFSPRAFPSLRRDATRVGIDRAIKDRRVTAMIDRLYGIAPTVEWEEVPRRLRVAAGSRLNKAKAGLASGEITQDEFIKLVDDITADLNAQDALMRARRATAQRRRGADWVRSRLLQYKDEGLIDEAGAEMADWFIRQNPQLANDLGVSAVKGAPLSALGGEYFPGSRIVQLVKESGDEATVVHEILHHTERMLPEDLQAAVTSEWRKRVGNELKTATTPEQKAFLQNVLTQEAPAKALTDIVEGRVPAAYYQYMNPSEFWAVNASNIVAGRYAAFNAGMVKKAKQWLTEFIQKAKSVFGLQSDAPIIQGLEAVMKGDGTFVSNRMLADVEMFRQVRPVAAGGPQVVTGAFKAGDGKGLSGTQSIIELAAKTADPTTLLHEGAHFIRKSILDAEDMDNVTAWLNSMGVKINHEFGEFVGSPNDIELAEEMFASAFEKYIVTGKAPTPPLERVFELVKNAFAGAYRWMKSNASKELYGEDALSPQVTAVFDKYFTAVPKKPIESTFDIIVRETRGAKATDAAGALDALAMEAARKGIPVQSPDGRMVKTTRDDLVQKIASLKLPDDVPNDTVLLDFPAPVLGQTQWTKGDIIRLQAEVVSRRAQMAVNPMRQALFGQPEETKVTENIYAALEEREEGKLATGARGLARGMAKLVLGGDIVSERGTRALPEVLRRDLDTPARIIEMTISDSVTVLTQSTRDNDPSFMFRFLAGENLRYKSGRRVVTSGHEHITGFFDLYRNQWSSMTREEQELLQEWAKLLNTVKNPENLRDAQTISEALAGAAFPRSLEGVKDFKDLQKQITAKSNAMVAALEKFIDLGGSGEGSIGGQLRKAIKDAAGEGSQIAFNEYRFAEVLLFLSGSTTRRGVRFVPVDATFSKDQLVEQAKTLLTEAQRIYGGADDPLFSRRLSILVAAYGSSRRAKAELAALGATLTAEEAHAFKNWTLAYNTTPEMSAQLELVKNKFGLNTKFVNETILGADVYVPAQARARMADALAKAQFNNAKLTPTGDLYQLVWTYMKKRMTRGAFAMRQRYFFVNTIDHFNQMYLLVGFGPAAASSARLLLQGIPVNLGGQAVETFIRGIGERIGVGDRASLERFRDLLSRGGDRVAEWVGSLFSVSKYRLEVNDILEGREKLLILGGNVYTGRQLRDMFVAEGIFSGFDTRRLAEGVRMDGNIFARDMDRIASSSKTSGPVADAAARLRDGAQDITVDVVDDLADAWSERERVGAAVTLMETGMDARAACRTTIDALYDYSQSMTKQDRSFLVGTILPFWAFQKNANQQFINVMFTPYGAYRMMALQRLREGSADLASELYYGYIGGELGLDVDNMPQDMQDLYYAIMTRAHEVYGDKLPDKVRIGLRIALTGRVDEVVDGKYYELDASLIEKMRSGGLVPGGKFGGVGMADYMLAAPNKSGLPSYVRDRFGMVAPQRRNALVRHYSALMGGANEDYFYFMLPESSVETAYKHTATLLGGAFLATGALTPKFVGIPGVEVFAGGADAIGLGDIGRALQPVVDLERSPVMGLALGMYSERGYPQRLHPKVAAVLQSMMSIPILRVPAKMDPFMGGTLEDTDEAFRARLALANAVQEGVVGGTDAAGNPTDLIEILGEDYVRMVQELNSKDLPADVMSVAKEERFYLPPGFMSLSFENSPLGEFNREALRWDQTSKEGADPAGQAAYFTRVLLSTDVVQVAPSRTAQQEEPVRYTKTRDPI
jgi:hypothetical protein